MLGSLVGASFFVNFGAGGFSISSLLSIRRSVHLNSPAFAAISELVWPAGKIALESIDILGGVSTKLKTIFEQGHASLRALMKKDTY